MPLHRTAQSRENKMPKFLRRKSSRPTQAIAFCAATAPLLLPQVEHDLIRDMCKSARLTQGSLHQILGGIGITDESFSKAVFALTDVHGTHSTKFSHFIVIYAVLRKLAFAEGDAALQAAQDAVWLAFVSAGDGFDTEKLSWPAWETFFSTIGEHIGGVESFPSHISKIRMRQAWKKASPLFANTLKFQTFMCMLRDYDAGLIQCLRAIGYVLTCAVIDSNSELMVRPVWNGDHESVFLGQFVSYAISEASAISSDSSLESASESAAEEMNERPTRGISSDGVGATDSSDSGNRARKGDSVDEMMKAAWGLSSTSPVSSRLLRNDISPTTVMAPASSSVRVLRRRMESRKSRSNTPFHIEFSSLKLGERIGSGAYGDVFHGTYLMSPVAVKMFQVNANIGSRDDQDPSQLNRMSTMNALKKFASTDSQAKYKNFVREVEMMSVVRHPNLVLYMGACGDPTTPLCIVSELFTGGSLFEFLHNDAEFQPSAKMACNFALNIARGMFYLHASQPSILHRDLKSRNVLLSGRKNACDGIAHVVICDFGLCQLFGEEGNSKEMGTASYMSPDVIGGKEYEGGDDVYSYGILLHEMLTGRVPYQGLRAMQVLFQVENEGLRPKCERDDRMPAELGALIAECWDGEREKRPMFDEIVRRITAIEQGM